MNGKHVSKNWLDQRAYQTMIENGFEPEFSPAVREQVAQIQARAGGQTNASVRNMQDLAWSSIDNATSRDLDQIEWAEDLPNGDIRVLVGIADVDESVDKDSPIDRHAAENTVTIYTDTEIFPMLPQELSTDLTSLAEGADRPAVVAEMVVKENGDVPESTFYRALVRNRAKLDYDSVGDWLDGHGEIPAKLASTPGLEEQIEIQQKAAIRLQKYRTAKGALQFESIESSAIIENGEVRGLKSVEPNSARKLIENFMVAANVEMAEFLENHNAPALRRIGAGRFDSGRRVAGRFIEAGGRQPFSNQPAGRLYQ